MEFTSTGQSPTPHAAVHAQLEAGEMAIDLSHGRCGLRYRPNRHVLMPHSPWVAAMRRKTGVSNLHLYRHAETHNYVLAQWLVEPPPGASSSGILREIAVLPGHPDRPAMKSPQRAGESWADWGVDHIKRLLRAASETGREIDRAATEWAKAEVDRQLREEADRKEYATHLARHTPGVSSVRDDRDINDIYEGRQPMASPDDPAVKQMLDRLSPSDMRRLARSLTA